MGVRTSVIDKWAERAWTDYLIAVIVIGAHLLIVRGCGSGDWLTWIGTTQRTDMYAAATGVVSAIGGLSAIAIAIYTTANGERLRAVRQQRHGELRRTWRSLLQGTALACLLILTAFSLDRDKDPLSARFIFEYAMVFAAFRFARFVWLFDGIMAVSDADLVEEGPSVAVPARDPNWLERRRRQHDSNP
ncbi:hypothetical protein ACIRO3_30125 [Streptomyces sp. NPDC102278]|uniref:hypothetical protein n=1 Tax=Streptomyces sp. NPDC102278 TaxID=3366152 RepID=UPI003823EA29